MQSAPKVSVIFPAYNERSRILTTVNDAISVLTEKNIPYEIIVAADGDDGTGVLIASTFSHSPQIKVIESKVRRGKGESVRAAVEIASGKYIGYVDADGKTPFKEFEKFWPLLEKGADSVIGNRWTRANVDPNRKWYRKLGSKLFLALMQNVIGLKGLGDTQCGFKFFSKAAAKNLFSLQTIRGYMFDVEILLMARRMGYQIEQVPVSFRDDGDTRLNLLSGNLANIRDILKVRWRSLLANPGQRSD